MKLKEKVSYGAVATAVAIACGTSMVGVVDAATLTVASTIPMSQQGNALVTSTAVQSFTVRVALERDYVQNDTAQLTLSGGTFPTSGTLTSAQCTSSVGTVTMGALSYSANTANYRATGSPAPVAGQICSFTVNVLSNSMSSGNVQIGYAAQTASSNVAFDSGAAITVGQVFNQFSSAVAQAFNGVVNTNVARLHFAADDGALFASGNEDHLSITITDRGATLTNAAALTTLSATIIGNFSFLDDDGTAGCTNSDITSNRGQATVSGGGSLSIDAGCTTLTWTETSGLASGVRTIALGKTNAASATAATNEKAIFAPQTFTSGGITFTYSAGSLGQSRTDGAAPGAHTLNGFSVSVPFMPYGTGRSRVVYITNNSSQTGAVSFTARNEAGTECTAANFTAVDARANAVTQLSSQLDAGIAACYGATFSGKVSFTVTANVPSATAELFTAYNNNGDIGVVVNQSNGYSATARP